MSLSLCVFTQFVHLSIRVIEIEKRKKVGQTTKYPKTKQCLVSHMTSIQHEMVKGQPTKFTESQFAWWAAKGLASKKGALPASSHDHTRSIWRWKCHGFGRDHHDWEDRTPHLSGECHRALLERQCHWGYCVSYARRHRNAFIFQDDNIVHVLSKITCNFAKSGLSEGQRISGSVSNWQFVRHPRETYLETVS